MAFAAWRACWPTIHSILTPSRWKARPAWLLPASFRAAWCRSAWVRRTSSPPGSLSWPNRGCAQYALVVDGRDLEVLAVSMGNPHCVLQVADVAAAPLAVLGPKIEHHERFPKRTNVGFMRIVDRSTIELRVHERGVGETLACGTGACAAVVCGQELGLLDADVDGPAAGRRSRGKLARRSGSGLAHRKRRVDL